jgi:hypothetical protein
LELAGKNVNFHLKTLKRSSLSISSERESNPSRKFLRVLIFVFVLVLFSGNADNQFAKWPNKVRRAANLDQFASTLGENRICVCGRKHDSKSAFTFREPAAALSIPFFANNLFCPAVIGRPFSLSRSLAVHQHQRMHRNDGH